MREQPRCGSALRCGRYKRGEFVEKAHSSPSSGGPCGIGPRIWTPSSKAAFAPAPVTRGRERNIQGQLSPKVTNKGADRTKGADRCKNLNLRAHGEPKDTAIVRRVYRL